MIPANRPVVPGGQGGQDDLRQVQPSFPQPLIVTLGLHAEDQLRFDLLRAAHFPASRNVISAHVTLFHRLPGESLKAVQDSLAHQAGALAPFSADVVGLRGLGRGVAFVLDSPSLSAIRSRLAGIWDPWLTRQDRQGFRPHVTIQNKVSPAEAAALLARMQADFLPFQVRAEALLLWRYLGGPWEAVARYQFGSGAGGPAITPPSITSV